jgi:cytochrome P450
MTALVHDVGKDVFQCPELDVGFFLFTMAWALNANSMPTIFWTVHYLLRKPALREQVMAQVYAVLKSETGWDSDTATEFPVLKMGTLEKMTLMRSLTLEALRMQSSIHLPRMVMEDTIIDAGGEKYFLRKGCILNATNVHHDPKVFPNPKEVSAERFLPGKKHFDEKGKGIAIPNMAFGHGQSTCLGRHFALMESPAAAVLYLTCFDWDPVDPQASDPPPDFRRYTFGCMPVHPDYENHSSVQYRRTRPGEDV